METKKANHANLEKRRPFFIQMGFVITLALVLMAFEWAVEKSAAKSFGGLTLSLMEEDMINTFRKEPEKVLERPKPKPIQFFDIIDDKDDLVDDKLDFSSETDQDEKIVINVQLDKEVGDEEIIFEVVEDMPVFRPAINKNKLEGDMDLRRYVMKQAIYPEMARETGIEGKVWVEFIVDEKGKVTNVKLVRENDPLLDNEALRVVRALPDFSPGKQREKPVKVRYHVPINFKLG
ncbi:MAG: energy transducer TonB [Bacteroidales bacterium]|nr:energy transducer TonB [Bacteroidales bacterium]MCF8458037.1 energy transducer TonB [Bacteroidales bacterium]